MRTPRRRRRRSAARIPYQQPGSATFLRPRPLLLLVLECAIKRIEALNIANNRRSREQQPLTPLTMHDRRYPDRGR